MQRLSKSNGTVKQSSSRVDKKADVSTAFDHEEMGMTQERQRVIQASLFKMLGQADSAPGPTDASSSTKSNEGSVVATTGSKTAGV
jgi:hypothetical protein